MNTNNATKQKFLDRSKFKSWKDTDIHTDGCNIPYAPGFLPGIGHLIPFLRKPFNFIAGLPEYGDIVKFRLGSKLVHVVCDPLLTKQVLSDDRTFDKGGLFFDREREWLGITVATCYHNEHRQRRRSVQHVVRPKRIAGCLQSISDEVSAKVNLWNSKRALDVYPEMFDITSRVFGSTMFSTTISASTQRQIVDDLSETFNGTIRKTLLPAVLNKIPTPRNKRFNKANFRLRKAMNEIVSERRQNPIDTGDLLSALLISADPDEAVLPEMSDSEIIDAVVTFFAAGTETTSATLSWALYMLALHPGVQKLLHVEVDEVLAEGAPLYTQLDKLSLTKRILKETLRLYPPAWFLTRVLSVDACLGSYNLPAGTVLAISPYMIHRRTDLYEDPDRFNPDRWLMPKEEASVPAIPYYIPFGGGARRCIGEHFALAEASVALATIASFWDLSESSIQKVRSPLSVSLVPEGLHLNIKSRR